MIVTGEAGVRVVGRYGDACTRAGASALVLDSALLRRRSAAGVEIDEGVLVRGPIA